MGTCESCGAHFAIGNDVVDGQCPDCGSTFYRYDPVPTHSDMEMRNMPAPGEKDMGGNPLQEGILADGGWKGRNNRDESFASVNASIAKAADYDQWLEQPYQDRQDLDIDAQDIDCPECGTKMNHHPTNDAIAVCPNPKCREELNIHDYADDLDAAAEEEAFYRNHYAAAEDDEFGLYKALMDQARKIQDSDGPEAADRYLNDQVHLYPWAGDYVFDAVRQTLQGDEQIPNLKQLLPDDPDSSADYFSIADMQQQDLKKDRGENSSMPDDTPDISHLPPELRKKDHERWLKELEEKGININQTREEQLQRTLDRNKRMEEKYGPIDTTTPVSDRSMDEIAQESVENAKKVNEAIYVPKLNWEPGKPGRAALFYGKPKGIESQPGHAEIGDDDRATLHTWPYDPNNPTADPMHAEYLQSLGINTANPDALKNAALFYIDPQGHVEAEGKTTPEQIQHAIQADPRIKPPKQDQVGGFAFARAKPHGSWLVDSDADFEMENADILLPDDETLEKVLEEDEEQQKVALDLGGMGTGIQAIDTDAGEEVARDIGLIPENLSIGELAGTASWLVGGPAIKAGLTGAKALGAGALATGAASKGAGLAKGLGGKALGLAKKGFPMMRNMLAFQGAQGMLGGGMGMPGMGQPQPYMPPPPPRTIQQLTHVAADHPMSDPRIHPDAHEIKDGDNSSIHKMIDVNDIGGTTSPGNQGPTDDPQLNEEFEHYLPVLVMYFLSESDARENSDPDFQQFLNRLEEHGLIDETITDDSELDALWDELSVHLDGHDPDQVKNPESAVGIGTQAHGIHAAIYDRYADDRSSNAPNLPATGINPGHVPRPPQAPAAPQAPSATPGTANCPRCGAAVSPGATTCPNCQSGVGVDQQAPQPGQVLAYTPQEMQMLQTPQTTAPVGQGQPVETPAQPVPQADYSAANCPNCGAKVPGGSAVCPHCNQSAMQLPQQPQQPQQVTVARTSADHQGPHNNEQFAAVAELLTSEGRQDEIPSMLAEPWNYAEEMARAMGRKTKPPIDDTQTDAPPMPAVEEAPPGATMPVPGMESPQMPLSSTKGTHAEVSEKTAESIDHHEAENPINAPAADRISPEDVREEQDTSLQWVDTNGEPLKVGQEYEMESPSWTIPDIVKIRAVKPDGIYVIIQSEQGLDASTEIDKHEAELERYTFTPSDATSVDEPIEDNLGNPDDPRQLPAAGSEQSDLSTPHFLMTHRQSTPDSIAPRCPNCNSGTTGIASKDGDVQCHACGKVFKEEILKDPVVSKMYLHQCPRGHEFGSRTRTASNLQCPECGSPLDPTTGLGEGVNAPDFANQDHPNPSAFTDPAISPQQETTPIQPVAANQDWEETFADVKAGLYGDWHDLRDQAIQYIQDERGPDSEDGISSSDINHTLFGLIRSGEIRPLHEQDPQYHPDFNTQDPANPYRDDSLYSKRTAGKKYTPFEQREFINEGGVARNKDKLQLEGTHYAEEENDEFLFGFDW